MFNRIGFIKTRTLKQSLWKSLNTLVAMTTLLNVSMAWIWMPNSALAAPPPNPSANLDQCANDPLPSPHTNGCATSATEWVNGNLNAAKSVYLENDSVPYRMRFDNLSLASHTVIIEWDTTKGGKHALDYLTTFNRTVADANPCLGVAGCAASTTFPIPVDPQVSGAGVTQIPGNFTLYGGTITGVSAYSYPTGAGFVGDKSAQIAITFTASSTNPVLAWGGHISDRHDWGQDNSAIAVPGSPYHMRLIDLDGSGGNQDRSLSADAVIFPGSVTVVKQASPEGSQSFAFTASPTPLANFNLVDDGTIANTKVFAEIIDFKTYTVVETLPAGWALDSIQCVDATGGTTTNVGTRTASIGLAEGDNVTCTYTNSRQAGLVTFEKIVVGGTAQPGDWTFTVGGVAGSFQSGDSTTLPTGNYTVTESGPAGYTSQSVGGICTNLQGNNATLTVGINGGTCTFTNARDTGNLKLIKHVVNDNGGNNPASDFTMHIKQADINVVTPFAGSEAGSTYLLPTGSYTVSESGSPSGYTQTSIVCDGQATSTVSVTSGQTKVCTITNNDVAPSITLSKVVINDNGGNAGVNDFGLTIGGTGVTSGQTLAVNANTPIALNEAGLAGYQFVSLTGHAKCPAVLGGTATLNEGENISCTITNDDQTASITLNKVVINDNGGNAGVNDFGLTIGGTSVNSGDTLDVSANTPIALNEAGLAGYTFVSITGHAKCPAVLGGTVTLNEDEHVTCTITNNDIAPTITLSKVVINDNGGNAGVNDFGLTIGGTGVTSGQTLPVNANTPIALNEAGLAGYSFVSLTGHAKCPQVLGGTATLNEGENISCTITNNDVAPTITLIKNVINDDGGNAGVNDFSLTIGGTPVVSGATLAVNANTPVALNEILIAGYEFVSLTGANCPTELGGTVSLNEGQNITCTITNDDVAPTITLIKNVINDHGGTAGVNDFGLTIGGTLVNSGDTLDVSANTPIALSEAGLNTYSFVSITGDAKCPQVLGGTVTLDEGQNITCTITNNDIAPRLTVYKVVINNDGGTAIPSNFTLNVNGTDASPSAFPGDDNGTLVTLDAGAYEVTEDFFPGYTPVFGPDCVGSIGIGESKSCTVTNTDDTPHLIVIKHVVNNNGGNNLAANFTMRVSGTDVSDSEFPGEEAGTTISLDVGGYNVTEDELDGYTASYSEDCKGTIALGETKVCTITNDDIAPTITLVKNVINNNGGNAGANDFGLTIGATSVSSGQTLVVNANTVYALNEAGLNGYAFVSLTGDTKCPDVLNGTVTLNEGEDVTCTITNDDIAPTITLSKFVINNNGGNAGVNDFGLTIGRTPVTSGTTKEVDANTPVALNEAGLTGYAFVEITGDAKCPEVLGGSVTLDEGEDIACTITNDDIAPTITLIKNVINNDGGNAGANDFGLTIGGTSVNSGDTLNVNANTPYTLNEAGLTGYEFVEITGDAKCPEVLGGTVSLNEGEDITCTITNNDIAPTITLIKEVINDNGGNAGANDFGLTIGGAGVNSNQTVSVNANSPYALNEAGLDGYDFVEITGDAKCPEVLGGSVTLDEGEDITCTIVNDDIAPTITLNKSVINDNGGNAGANDFGLTIGATSVNSGQTLGVSANTPIALNEAGLTGYAFVEITGDAKCPEILGGSVTLDEGEDITCTIINNDILASLNIVKTDSPDPVQAGGVITYTIEWSLSGEGFADNLLISDSLPTLTTYVTASADCGEATDNPTTGTCDINDSGDPLSWFIGIRTAGDSGKVTFQAAVDSPLADGTEIENTACLERQEEEGASDRAINLVQTDQPNIVCDDTTTEVDSDFTVTIVKSDNTDPVSAGGQVVYTLDWTLSGNAPVDSLIITDALPANTTFVSASLGGVHNSGNPGIVTWNLGSYPLGIGSGSVTVTVKVASPIANGTQLTDFAEICGLSFTQTEQEVIEHCDDDTEITTVSSAPILSIVKTNSVSIFTNPGKDVTYTLDVTNAANATDTAHNVIVTDILPAGFSFKSSTPTQFSVIGQAVTWHLGSLAPGNTVKIVYVVTISASQASGLYTNTATAVASNHGPVSANSVVEVRQPQVLGSVPVIDLSIVKTVNPNVTNPGKVVTYTLTIKNIGDADATNVSVTDTLPTGFTFVEGGKSVKTFEIGTLPANHSRVINYEVRVGNDVKDGHYQNTAVLTADGIEPKSSQADVEVRVPKVLGLATTGVSLRDYVIFSFGFSALAFGLYALRRRNYGANHA